MQNMVEKLDRKEYKQHHISVAHKGGKCALYSFTLLSGVLETALTEHKNDSCAFYMDIDNHQGIIC